MAGIHTGRWRSAVIAMFAIVLGILSAMTMFVYTNVAMNNRARLDETEQILLELKDFQRRRVAEHALQTKALEELLRRTDDDNP